MKDSFQKTQHLVVDEIQSPLKIDDLDNEQIADAIKLGFTSGVISNDHYRVSWSLKTEIFI